ncbi:4-hydroxybutyrate coenzyme A transferase [Loa loa]|uniref:4-hydroxybutyrate coenzyme A transferase n=1 Tax=Loa loa TaxID=7209 RepID=A0A1S0TLH4_LOALO|nr:4-hydroxybutyrate coenzyme A transferase [Loa loa]EFO16254.1 4-hydroxybutyrate coenzyme A transferase [Loa loa]
MSRSTSVVQLDFIRGATKENDELGKPIVAITSTTRRGQSKIMPYINERAYELIRISHPSQREQLEKAAFERMKVMPSSD